MCKEDNEKEFDDYHRERLRVARSAWDKLRSNENGKSELTERELKLTIEALSSYIRKPSYIDY